MKILKMVGEAALAVAYFVGLALAVGAMFGVAFAAGAWTMQILGVPTE